MNSKFLFGLMITAIIGAVGYWLLFHTVQPKFYYPNYIYIVGWFTISTGLFHYGLTQSATGGGNRFIRFYMGATGLKLLIYILIIVVYALINKDTSTAFALCFLLMYVLFTVFEVMTSYKQFGSSVKSPSKMQENSNSDVQDSAS